jgi:hypothetical protein
MGCSAAEKSCFRSNEPVGDWQERTAHRPLRNFITKLENREHGWTSKIGIWYLVIMAGNEWDLDRPGDFIASDAFQLAIKTEYAGASGNSLWIT